MTRPAVDMGREANCRLHDHLGQVQSEAFILEALIEGLAIIKAHQDGSNAFEAVVSLALEKASAIAEALDSVNLSKLDAIPD